MSDIIRSTLPIAIIGAGPIGLAAAAHLVHRGYAIALFEAGSSIAANLQSYRHVQLFSPWQYNIDPIAAELLQQETGWKWPMPNVLPTAGEVIDQYLLPLSGLRSIAPFLRVNAKVLAVARQGFDKVKTQGRQGAPFVLRVQMSEAVEEFLASAVIDASGTWSQPSPMGAHGLPALGELENANAISYGMPDVTGRDRTKFEGKKVLVVGAGHSAVGSLLALASLAEQDSHTRVVWAVRGHDISRAFGGGDADALPARGALGSRLHKLIADGLLEVHIGFKTHAIVQNNSRLTVIASDASLPHIADVDHIIVATGARPDHRLSRELRTQHDPWLESTLQLAPLIDPNEHSCGSVRPHGHRELAHPEADFYAIGAKSYGRAPNFLMATGYEQARSVVAAIAGDIVAADNVQLTLPQTGVCSSRPRADDGAVASGCCTPIVYAPAKTAGSCCNPGAKSEQISPGGADKTKAISQVSSTRSCCG
ncbi:FAD-dependent oxidoreductase [Rheinheimera sp. F8]|uniref:FAD-dependent oxidoreductase n=1 Tax=Rheinheimera sp. F8 TaxID=1763998 RepID=UPI000A9CFD25|nr:FAD-dependent oxidoreductase [Rheinheimera sp. F8]